MTLALRPVQPADRPFLYRVYASTREAELALVDWTPAQKEAFLEMQFTAQDRYYREHFRDATFDVVLWEAAPAGRLYVARWPEEIRIIDIALLPEYRNRGIGSELLRELLEEAQQVGKPVRIHVEQFNPAQRLYERLGFARIADEGVYFQMEWSPARRPGDG